MGRTIALISYSFHEVVRKLFLWLMARHAKNAIRIGAPLKWRTISEEFKKPGFLLAVSVLGPRWNCHALLATLSPIPVRQTLSIDLAGLSDHSDSWSIVLYDESWTTREWLGSTTRSDRAVSWTLPAGFRRAWFRASCRACPASISGRAWWRQGRWAETSLTSFP